MEPWKIEGYGWKKQQPDWRDHVFAAPAEMPLPNHVNLTASSPPIWSQGNLGSCTAHGTLRAYWMARKKQKQALFMPSRLLQYYNSRWLEGTSLIDAGATCRDAIKAIAKWGICDESLWPYNIKAFNKMPSKSVYAEAEKHQAIAYQAVPQNLYAIKSALAQGNAIVFGFTVYSNFEHQNGIAKTGMMEMPKGYAVSGHCVCAVGYNSKNYLMCANSWGTKWGDPSFPGHFWMPPEYYLHSSLSGDFWIIQTTEP